MTCDEEATGIDVVVDAAVVGAAGAVVDTAGIAVAVDVTAADAGADCAVAVGGNSVPGKRKN